MSSEMKFSEFFDVTLGLKQGEPLSPILFILFINDISTTLDFNKLTENDLNQLSMYMLLFADDIALFTTDPNSLQAQLDIIYTYSEKWGFKINVQKTKICVFEKRKSHHNFNWFINGEQIEVVDHFKYLGVDFLYTGVMKNAVKVLSEQALKAYSSLLSLFTRVHIDVKTKLSLFDTMVVPILTYCSEVWGIYDFKEIDKLHIKFCKTILGVRQQTPNLAVYGELGRFPLSVICKQRALKYWLKIMQNPNSPMYRIFMEQCNNSNDNCWAKSIKRLLDSLGYSDIWNNFDYNVNYLPMFKQRICDQFIQNWRASVQSMSKLDYYSKFKTEFCFEKYIDVLTNEGLRKELSCFRLSSHKLEIELGRFVGTVRNERICKMCNLNCIESEYHFLLCCPLYVDIRRKYFGNISWPTIQKCVNILSSTYKKSMNNTAKYLKDAFERRNETLERIAAS
ncbi:uncharacterized protein LOC128550759 [Mercenaria mercenaria]|uniref:uncharacterized protein LOC128550759 n=1 Tax=Mercenaria mercenaria TaxID=6596 RepID=UPI00234FA0D3|nr:uncharacterized protein LOC128550759 [Mercenaria mercenaria]